MLTQALALRERLQSIEAAAVPESSIYRKLPMASEQQLWAGIPAQVRQNSQLLSHAPNSWVSTADTVDDSAQALSCQTVDQLVWRPHKYNEKYASQELSLLYQLYRLGGESADLVIDAGGGNANLSCLIALVFDVPVVCVEMDSPRVELRGEEWLPEAVSSTAPVTRVESMIQEYELPDGYNKVVVIGKHLCGPGTDAGIQFVAKHAPRMLGCVFATCCCCKIVGDQGERLFGELYFGEARRQEGCPPESVSDDSSVHWTALTEVARATSWRNNQHSTQAYPELVAHAEYFESWIQHWRRKKLQALFGQEQEVLYCHESGHSQQNRCLVSGTELHTEVEDDHEGFFKLLERRFATHREVLPVDLRARGLVCLLYTSDAADEEDSVDLGGRRIIKKKYK
eukprot:TRINITY_DN5974_c0_g1_i1.p1 TRINITY_DN5974_c0_g1~~TRINITY_DN5974_c0_g1_i1.p1  ORF type:complete len:398 (-),score=61.40 TRINITY_DN5974_c0_g1_i1:68-1261(-)